MIIKIVSTGAIDVSLIEMVSSTYLFQGFICSHMKKKTHDKVYLHWKSFAPPTWKRSTVLSIITRAYRICSTQEHLEAELLKIKHEFTQINGYQKSVLEKPNEECKLSGNLKINTNYKSKNNDITNTIHMLVLPCKI